MSASEASSLIGRRLGRFRILSRIGQGGLATVWRAHDEMLGRDVALKVLHESLAHNPKVRRRFVHEAKAASSLEHPGIVTVFEAGEEGDLAFMALTLIEGETVSELASRRRLPIDEAVRIIAAASDALSHAHERGVIHRDVSGRNVMVARDGRVFVLDFGLALAVGQSRVTTSETTLGTIAYMAPEALQGTSIDARADVYGLGVVLFEALTGTYPYGGERTEQQVYSKVSGSARSPSEVRPEVPPQLDFIVDRALAHDPADRYPTMAGMLRDLRVFAGGGGIPMPEERRPAPLLKRVPLDPGLETQTTLPDPAYLAILPFRAVGDSGTAGGEQFLASRLADAIGAALGAVSHVRVVAVSASEAAEWETDPEREWAERVGANLVLSGQVARAGARMRVTYSIRDPWRGVQVAGGVTDGSDAHAFDLEDAAVVAIRQSLGASDGAPDSASRPADAATDDRFRIAQRYLERYDLEASVDGAIRVLEQLSVGTAAQPEHWATLARAYLAKQRLTKERSWGLKAATACQRARTGAPDAITTRIAIADLEVATGRAAEARALLAPILAEYPDDVEANLVLARAALADRVIDTACRSAERVIAMRPGDWRGHNVLGLARFESSDFAGAAQAWGSVVRLVPDSARGHMNLGSAMYRVGRFDEAVRAYRASLDIHPTATGYTNVGTALYYLGDTEGSLQAFERAAALRPDDPVVLGNLGNACCKSEGHEARGRQVLERAILLARDRLESNPADAVTRSRMAGWLANVRELEHARTEIERALQDAHDDPDVFETAGHVYFQLGDRERAVALIRDALSRGYGLEEFRRSRELAPLRSHPALKELLDSSTPATDGDSQTRRTP